MLLCLFQRVKLEKNRSCCSLSFHANGECKLGYLYGRWNSKMYDILWHFCCKLKVNFYASKREKDIKNKRKKDHHTANTPLKITLPNFCLQMFFTSCIQKIIGWNNSLSVDEFLTYLSCHSQSLSLLKSHCALNVFPYFNFYVSAPGYIYIY